MEVDFAVFLKMRRGDYLFAGIAESVVFHLLLKNKEACAYISKSPFIILYRTG